MREALYKGFPPSEAALKRWLILRGTAVLYGTVSYDEKGTATFDGTICFEFK